MITQGSFCELGIGIIGAGANTIARHIPGFLAIPGVRIKAVCNQTEESGERVAEQFGIERVYVDWRELVSSPEIDAVLIGTWPYLHCEATCFALERGKHVLCEARMAMDLDEARRMLKASRAHPQCVAQVVPSPFTLEIDETMKREIGSGRLGRVFAGKLCDLSGFADPEALLHWREDKRLSGLNVMTLGIWYEAFQRWLGRAEGVFAMAKTVVRQRRSNGSIYQVEIPDHLELLTQFPRDVQVQMSFSRAAGGVNKREVLIFGDSGTLKFSDGRLSRMLRGENDFVELLIPKKERIGWRVEEEFVAAIRGAEEVKYTSFEDGVRYMAFTEAVWQSIESRSWVEIPNLE